MMGAYALQKGAGALRGGPRNVTHHHYGVTVPRICENLEMGPVISRFRRSSSCCWRHVEKWGGEAVHDGEIRGSDGARLPTRANYLQFISSSPYNTWSTLSLLRPWIAVQRTNEPLHAAYLNTPTPETHNCQSLLSALST